MAVGDLAEGLARVDPQAPVPWRLIREFLIEFAHEDPEAQAALIATPPDATGSRRWDAFVAALAEHLAFHHRLLCPAWTQDENRSLASAWFLSDLPSARAAALETSPASFRRRLIFVDRADLTAA